MTASRNDEARSRSPHQSRGEQLAHVEELKDEVYRQMFRLEASRPGADVSLAIALLRAWVAAGSDHEMTKARVWLKKISPICILMIESARQANCTGQKCTK